MPHLHPFASELAAAWPPHEWQDLMVLVAVSGGCDSIALLRGMTALADSPHRPQPSAGRLIATHYNHRLRGRESDEDEQFVASLARNLGLTTEIGRAVRPPVAARQGLEAACRRERYRFLRRAAAKHGARYVVTAHTADDQVETVLHRILRGTGLKGLAGMPRARPLGPATLLRPLLGFQRSVNEAYLRDIGQPYRSDTTNRELRFTRNRIRHDLLPKLAADYDAQVGRALLRLSGLAADAQATIETLAGELAEACCMGQSEGGSNGATVVDVDCRRLASRPRHLLREVMIQLWRRRQWPERDMTFRHWDALAGMARRAASGSAVATSVFPGNVIAETTAGRLRLSRGEPKTNRP